MPQFVVASCMRCRDRYLRAVQNPDQELLLRGQIMRYRSWCANPWHCVLARQVLNGEALHDFSVGKKVHRDARPQCPGSIQHDPHALCAAVRGGHTWSVFYWRKATIRCVRAPSRFSNVWTCFAYLFAHLSPYMS